MNLIIESALTEPPSSIACFRDVSLYGKTFVFEDVLVVCKKGTRSIFWRWLKQHGAHDFISYLLREDEIEDGFLMHTQKGDVVVDKIDAFNLSFLLRTFNRIRPRS
jgi:hypothetical protein